MSIISVQELLALLLVAAKAISAKLLLVASEEDSAELLLVAGKKASAELLLVAGKAISAVWLEKKTLQNCCLLLDNHINM